MPAYQWALCTVTGNEVAFVKGSIASPRHWFVFLPLWHSICMVRRRRRAGGRAGDNYKPIDGICVLRCHHNHYPAGSLFIWQSPNPSISSLSSLLQGLAEYPKTNTQSPMTPGSQRPRGERSRLCGCGCGQEGQYSLQGRTWPITAASYPPPRGFRAQPSSAFKSWRQTQIL